MKDLKNIIRNSVLGVFFAATVVVAAIPDGGTVAHQDGWGGIVNLSDDGVAQYMGYGYQWTVATDTAGNVHLVWYDNRTGRNQVYYRKWSKSSGTWGPITQITNQLNPVYRPAVACDYSGNVHVVWYHSSSGVYGIWYKRWNVNTGSWEDSVWLYNPGGNYLNYYPSIACRPGGDNVHIVWYGRDAANPTYYRVRHIEYTPGSGWDPVTIVDTMPAGMTEVASVAVDRWDSVYVVWRTQVSGYYQVFYRWRNGNGVWRSIEQVSDVNPNVHMYACAAAVDSMGSTVHVVWNGDIPGSSNDRIFYRSRTGSGWNNTEIVSTYENGVQYDPVVDVDQDGGVHIVWRGFTAVSTQRMEVLYRWKRDGEWGNVWQLTNRSSGSNVLLPCLDCDRFDDLHIVWYDDSDGDNDVYYIRGELVDAGVAQIITPTGSVPPGASVTPVVKWHNFSFFNQVDFWTFCFLFSPSGSQVYAESIYITALPVNTETTVYFPGFTVNSTGTWTVRCSTSAAMDKDNGNDVREANFEIYSTDIQMFQIQAPSGTVDTGTVVTPRARWWNRSTNQADFVAYFQLFNASGNRVYFESLVVNGLQGHRDTILYFPATRISGAPGLWRARCSTFCLSDTSPENDTLSVNFTVRALPNWPYGWKEVRSMPLSPSNKGPGDGAWLTQKKVSGNRYIYALKGNKTGDFYLYDPIGDTWRQLKPMPLGSDGKPPRRGSVGVAGGDYIYATNGNNTLGFWRYSLVRDTWEQLKDIPSNSGKRVKAGTDMVYIKRPQTDTGYVYLLKGYTDEFYRYNTISGEWDTLAPAPLTVSGRRWDRGSWIVYSKVGQNYYIYAHKAKIHELWKYDVLGDSWFSQQLNGMPYQSRLTGRFKKSRDGSAGAWYDGAIYALKGGNTCEFWRYDAGDDYWDELDTIPQAGFAGRRRRVKGGGDIVLYEDGAFFALKGGKSPELWRYLLVDTVFTGSLKGSNAMTNSASEVNCPDIVIFPNPLVGRLMHLQLNVFQSALVKVYDVTGRAVLSKVVAGRDAVINLEGFSAGVYIVEAALGNKTAAIKVVLK